MTSAKKKLIKEPSPASQSNRTIQCEYTFFLYKKYSYQISIYIFNRRHLVVGMVINLIQLAFIRRSNCLSPFRLIIFLLYVSMWIYNNTTYSYLIHFYYDCCRIRETGELSFVSISTDTISQSTQYILNKLYIFSFIATANKKIFYTFHVHCTVCIFIQDFPIYFFILSPTTHHPP